MAAVVALSACTGDTAPGTSTSAPTTQATDPTTSTTVAPPPTVDVGVDLEASIVRLAVVGDIPDDLWRGHFLYWDSVNDDLGGIGGRLLVELVQVDSVSDARAVGALAISLDGSAGPEQVEGILTAEHESGLDGGSRLVDVTDTDIEAALSGARTALLDERLPYLRADYEAEVLVADTGCTEFGDTLEIDRRRAGSIEAGELPAVYYLCVTPGEALSAAAEALSSRPGSLLVIPGSAWRPELAGLLDGSDVVISGYLPGPGVVDAPASELMALVLGEGPWTGLLVQGYTAALSMHLVLEAALERGDLTQEGVIAASQEMPGQDLGFGPAVAIGILDASAPTGVEFLVWAG